MIKKCLSWGVPILLTATGLLLISTCNQEEENTGIPPEKATPIDPAKSGTIRGHVLFQGTPPQRHPPPIRGTPECQMLHGTTILEDDILIEKGYVQNVFVYIKEGLEKFVFATPQTPIEIGNVKCLYAPRVAGAMTHQPVKFTNSDPLLHNIHSRSDQGSTFNFGLSNAGRFSILRIHKAEVLIKLTCDVHPWMTGYLGVLDHPYFTITGPEGAFEWSRIPAGDYVIEAWHERFGTKTRKVTVEAQKAQEIDFSFP